MKGEKIIFQLFFRISFKKYSVQSLFFRRRNRNGRKNYYNAVLFLMKIVQTSPWLELEKMDSSTQVSQVHGLS